MIWAMNDTELYRQVLGLVEPWQVSRVDLSAENVRIDVWVEHPRRTRFACPQCERELPVYTTPTSASGATWTAVSS